MESFFFPLDFSYLMFIMTHVASRYLKNSEEKNIHQRNCSRKLENLHQSLHVNKSRGGNCNFFFFEKW